MSEVLAMAGPGALELLSALEGALRKDLASRGDRLRIDAMKGWVAFRSRRSRRTFAEVRPRRHHLEAFLLPGPSAMKRVGIGVQGVPPTRGWGWFNSRLILRPGQEALGRRAFLKSYGLIRLRRRRPAKAK
jgi:hypothetical protein